MHPIPPNNIPKGISSKLKKNKGVVKTKAKIVIRIDNNKDFFTKDNFFILSILCFDEFKFSKSDYSIVINDICFAFN